VSIRTRITLVGVGIVTLVICCLSGTLFGLISRGLDTDRDKLLAARATSSWPASRPPPRPTSRPATALAPIDPRSNVDIFTMVLADDGTPLRHTGEVDGAPIRVPPETLAAARRDGRATASVPVAGGQPGEAVRVQVRRGRGPTSGARATWWPPRPAGR
jgi:hypothetical protein